MLGGQVWGIGAALTEASEVDPRFGGMPLASGFGTFRSTSKISSKCFPIGGHLKKGASKHLRHE